MALRGTAFGTATNTTGSSPCVVNVGGIGIQQNDLILLCAYTLAGGRSTQTLSTPSGFTPYITNYINGSVAGNFILFYKVASNSEPSTYSVTSTPSTFFAGSVVCRVYSGRSGAFTANAVTSDNFQNPPVASWSWSATGVTAALGDDVAVFYGFDPTAQNNFTWVPPTGFGNGVIAQDTVNIQVGPTFSADYLNVSAGATGTLTTNTFTNSGADTAGHWGAFVIAMTQGSSGGPASAYKALLYR